MEIGIGLQGFPFEKDFYYILLDYFQKSKNIFRIKTFSQREALRYFQHQALLLSSHALLFSSHALQLSLTCKHRVAKFNLCYTFIRFHIYIFCALKKSFPFIKDCMTYTPFSSRTRAPYYWCSHISLGISSPHLQMPRHTHRQCYP